MFRGSSAVAMAVGSTAVGLFTSTQQRHYRDRSASRVGYGAPVAFCDGENSNNADKQSTQHTQNVYRQSAEDNGVIAVYLSQQSRDQLRRYLAALGRPNVDPRCVANATCCI
jgi:hypothetical protein